MMNASDRALVAELNSTLRDIQGLIDLSKARANLGYPEPSTNEELQEANLRWLKQVDRNGNYWAAPLLETKAKCLLGLATIQGAQRR